MKSLNIVLAGYGPDISSRVKTMSYAPFALKAYLDVHLPKPIRDNINTTVFDFKWDTTVSDMVSEILAAKPDVIGFSVYLWSCDKILECAKEIKKITKETKIILGGPQVSPIAEEVLENNPYIDIISFMPSCGEAILYNLVQVIYENKDINIVDGIVYRDGRGKVVKTSASVKDLAYETIPSPYGKDIDVFPDPETYMAVIETSRGCPFDCGYCFWGSSKRKISFFPMDRILRDIEIVYNNLNVKHVFFVDSNLFSNTKRVNAILECVLNQKSQARTEFEINFVHLKESTAKLLSAFPDFRYTLALQSANPNALKLIGEKRPTPEMFSNKLKELKQWIPNPKYQIDLMLGLPGDDLEGFLKSIDFSLSLEPLYTVVNYPVYLLPGSRFFENKETLGLKYTTKTQFAITGTPTFPQDDLEKALRISIWLQILTFYYQAISNFFYKMAGQDGMRIQRLLMWIDNIEAKVKLFDLPYNLTDMGAVSLIEWNKIKKALLEKASTADSASYIYSSIYELEKKTADTALIKDIELGRDIFNHMHRCNIDAIEFDSYDLLPKEIIKGKVSDNVKDLFSTYRR